MSSVQTLPLLNAKNWKLNNYQTEGLMIRADCLQDDQKQFVPLFFPFLRESSIKTSVKAILFDSHCFPFSLLLRVCNFNSSHAEGRLNASLFYFIKIVMSSCSAFDERRLRWNFNRSETSKHWRVKKYLNIQKVWVNWHKWPRKHFRGKWIQFDRAESVSSWLNYLCSRCRSLAGLHFTSERNYYLY